MKSNKKFIVYLIILVILIISFVLILLGRSGLLFKIKGNIGNLINTTNLEVSFKTEDNNVIVDYKNNSPLEYQIVESDFYTVNNVRLILKNRDRFLNAFDNYINIYSNNQNNEEIDYKALIDNFNNGKTNTIIESNEKINNVLNDLSLSDSWITLDNNIINVENDNKDRVIIVRDLNNNYYVYYSINSKEIVDFEQCEINEEYLQYLSLSSEEKKNIEIIPEVCIETKIENRMLRKSSVDSGTYPSKYPANFGTDEFFNSTHMRIKTQMDTPFCVMFSTMATLENYLYTKYHQHYTFSEEYAALKMTRLFVDSSTGVIPVTNPIGYRHDMEHGFSNWSAAKFIAYYGPIYDDELAWRNSTGKARISILDNRVGKVDVNEVRVTNSMSIDEIKENITTYGANKFGALITREDFKNKYYHYNDSNYSSHAITAIGWDDNISNTLFKSSDSSRPVSNGAFIIKNSYGDYDYNSLNGYFYLSYYQFRRNYLAIQDADFDFNDNEYFYDYGGPVESLLTKYQAIKVTKKNSREVLKRIKYSVFSDATVSIYFIPDGNSTLSINNATLLMDNKTVKAGIHTYDLETPIELTNDTFYIIVGTSDNNKLAFQHFSEQSKVVSPPENISFSSTNGSTFTDSATNGYTSMIAAYTDNLESSDTTNPTAQLHFSSERDDPNPTLLLQCRDNKGATGYYFGTSSPNSSNMTNTDNINKINNEGIIFENVKEGTYYLGCKDAAGNTDVASININKYVVNNYYEKLESTSTNPDPSNYDLISSYTLYVKNGSKIFPEEIYKVTGQFIGYTKTTGSSTSELTGNKIEVNDNDSVYNMYFNRDKKTYTISASGLNGKVKVETIYQPNNEITVTISNPYVSGASG